MDPEAQTQLDSIGVVSIWSMERTPGEQRRWEHGLRRGSYPTASQPGASTARSGTGSRKQSADTRSRSEAKPVWMPTPTAAAAALDAYLLRECGLQRGTVLPTRQIQLQSGGDHSELQTEPPGCLGDFNHSNGTKPTDTRKPSGVGASSGCVPPPLSEYAVRKNTVTRPESPLSRFKKQVRQARWSAGLANSNQERPVRTNSSHRSVCLLASNYPLDPSDLRAAEAKSVPLVHSLMEKIRESKRLRQASGSTEYHAVHQYSSSTQVSSKVDRYQCKRTVANPHGQERRDKHTRSLQAAEKKTAAEATVSLAPSSELMTPLECAKSSLSTPVPIPHSKPVMPLLPPEAPTALITSVPTSAPTTKSVPADSPSAPSHKSATNPSSKQVLATIESAIVATRAAVKIQRLWKRKQCERHRPIHSSTHTMSTKPMFKPTKTPSTTVETVITATNAAQFIQWFWKKRYYRPKIHLDENAQRHGPEDHRFTVVVDEIDAGSSVLPLFSAAPRMVETIAGGQLKNCSRHATGEKEERTGSRETLHDTSRTDVRTSCRTATTLFPPRASWVDDELSFLEEGRFAGELDEAVRTGVFMDADELVWKRPQDVIALRERQRIATVEKTRQRRAANHRVASKTICYDEYPMTQMGSRSDAGRCSDHSLRSPGGQNVHASLLTSASNDQRRNLMVHVQLHKRNSVRRKKLHRLAKHLRSRKQLKPRIVAEQELDNDYLQQTPGPECKHGDVQSAKEDTEREHPSIHRPTCNYRLWERSNQEDSNNVEDDTGKNDFKPEWHHDKQEVPLLQSPASIEAIPNRFVIFEDIPEEVGINMHRSTEPTTRNDLIYVGDLAVAGYLLHSDRINRPRATECQPTSQVNLYGGGEGFIPLSSAKPPLKSLESSSPAERSIEAEYEEHLVSEVLSSASDACNEGSSSGPGIDDIDNEDGEVDKGSGTSFDACSHNCGVDTDSVVEGDDSESRNNGGGKDTPEASATEVIGEEADCQLRHSTTDPLPRWMDEGPCEDGRIFDEADIPQVLPPTLTERLEGEQHESGKGSNAPTSLPSSHPTTDSMLALKTMETAVHETLARIHAQYRDVGPVGNQSSSTCNYPEALMQPPPSSVSRAPASQPRLGDEKRLEFLQVLSEFRRCLRPGAMSSATIAPVDSASASLSPCRPQPWGLSPPRASPGKRELQNATAEFSVAEPEYGSESLWGEAADGEAFKSRTALEDGDDADDEMAAMLREIRQHSHQLALL